MKKRIVYPTEPIYNFNDWWTYIREQIRESKKK
jgi:hypothetical protein